MQQSISDIDSLDTKGNNFAFIKNEIEPLDLIRMEAAIKWYISSIKENLREDIPEFINRHTK